MEGALSQKALSVRQPYADGLVFGVKPIEYRSWATTHRGILLIHAGRKFESMSDKIFQALMRNRKFKTAFPSKNITAVLKERSGGIIGAVKLTDVELANRTEYQWRVKPIGYFVNPILMTGKLNLMNVHVNLAEEKDCGKFIYW